MGGADVPQATSLRGGARCPLSVPGDIPCTVPPTGTVATSEFPTVCSPHLVTFGRVRKTRKEKLPCIVGQSGPSPWARGGQEPGMMWGRAPLWPPALRCAYNPG